MRIRKSRTTGDDQPGPLPVLESAEGEASSVQYHVPAVETDITAVSTDEPVVVPRVINATPKLAPSEPEAPVAPIADVVSRGVVAAPDPLGLLVGARFAAALRPLYRERLKGVYLFGNRALGAAPEQADVELLVVLDQAAAYGDELEKTSNVCAQLTLELGLVVSRVFVGQAQWSAPVEGFVPVVEEPPT